MSCNFFFAYRYIWSIQIPRKFSSSLIIPSSKLGVGPLNGGLIQVLSKTPLYFRKSVQLRGPVLTPFWGYNKKHIWFFFKFQHDISWHLLQFWYTVILLYKMLIFLSDIALKKTFIFIKWWPCLIIDKAIKVKQGINKYSKNIIKHVWNSARQW